MSNVKAQNPRLRQGYGGQANEKLMSKSKCQMTNEIQSPNDKIQIINI